MGPSVFVECGQVWPDDPELIMIQDGDKYTATDDPASGALDRMALHVKCEHWVGVDVESSNGLPIATCIPTKPIGIC